MESFCVLFAYLSHQEVVEVFKVDNLALFLLTIHSHSFLTFNFVFAFHFDKLNKYKQN